MRIAEFDVWRPGYGGASVKVYEAGTTTLAPVFSDEACTVGAANPQILLSWSDAAGNLYGKFAQPIYTNVAYQININSTDQTGIDRPPLTELDGVDASAAEVTPTDGGEVTTLADLASRYFDIRNSGPLSPTDSATNTTTFENAIGIASAAGGGHVIVPPGTWPVIALSLPPNVVLEGFGRGVTTITSQTNANVLTLTGDRAGLAHLTLDGIDLIASSVGVYAVNRSETVFDDAEVKRFDTGMWFKGGHRNHWRDLYLSGCNINAKLHGDSDSGATGLGDLFRNNDWTGGKVDLENTDGVQLFYKDKRCSHWVLRQVGFENSSGMAVRISGARLGAFEGCWWLGNTGNVSIADDSDTSNAARLNNTCEDIAFRRCLMGPADGSTSPPPAGGMVTIAGTALDIVFDQCEFQGVAITLNSPQNAIQVRDCLEDSNVTLSGDGTKWIRIKSMNRGASFGLTSGAVATRAWSETLKPGQIAYVEAKILGIQRDGVDVAQYHIARQVKRPGSTLPYDTRTVTFTVGTIVTGQTSGATARILADTNSTSSGVFTLKDIIGAFTIGETMTDTAGGSARCAGAQTDQDAVALAGLLTIATAFEDDSSWDATIDVNSGDVRVMVTGDTAMNIEWTVDVEMTTN